MWNYAKTGAILGMSIVLVRVVYEAIRNPPPAPEGLADGLQALGVLALLFGGAGLFGLLLGVLSGVAMKASAPNYKLTASRAFKLIVIATAIAIPAVAILVEFVR